MLLHSWHSHVTQHQAETVSNHHGYLAILLSLSPALFPPASVRVCVRCTSLNVCVITVGPTSYSSPSTSAACLSRDDAANLFAYKLNSSFMLALHLHRSLFLSPPLAYSTLLPSLLHTPYLPSLSLRPLNSALRCLL